MIEDVKILCVTCGAIGESVGGDASEQYEQEAAFRVGVLLSQCPDCANVRVADGEAKDMSDRIRFPVKRDSEMVMAVSRLMYMVADVLERKVKLSDIITKNVTSNSPGSNNVH